MFIALTPLCSSIVGKHIDMNAHMLTHIAEQGARVKKGQTLAFIEQLGTFVPVEVSPLFCPGRIFPFYIYVDG